MDFAFQEVAPREERQMREVYVGNLKKGVVTERCAPEGIGGSAGGP